MPQGRVVAIDYGRARIGVAISDPMGIIASPLATVPGKLGPKGVLESFSDKQVRQIVVGLPLLLSGKKGEMALEVDQFVEKLEALTDIPVLVWDERLTSIQAERHLKESGMNRKQRAKVSDEAAAMTILQSYLATQ